MAKLAGGPSFIYHDTLFEVSYLRNDQFQSSDDILSDYHLAPSFRTTKIMCDPSGRLTPLLAGVCRDYAKRKWSVSGAGTPGTRSWKTSARWMRGC